MGTHDVTVPNVLRIILVTLVPTVTEDSLYFILLLQGGRCIGVCVGDNVVLVELIEILNIIYIVWNFATTAGHADLISRDPRFLLLL